VSINNIYRVGDFPCLLNHLHYQVFRCKFCSVYKLTVLAIYRCYFAVSCAVTSIVLTKNLALKRPSYQSSVWTDQFVRQYGAKWGNDGTRKVIDNTTLHVHSLLEDYPWWAVNLGRPATVYKVNFTNTDHPFQGKCYNNFCPHS